MAAYGQEPYIADALDSLLVQEFTDWEAIVVDDGSPDGVMAVAERYAATDRRIRLLRTPNRGVGAARNAAAAVARGRYLTFLDGDDMFRPCYMADAVRVLEEEPDVSLVYGQWEYFGATTTTPPLQWEGYGALLLGNSIHVSAVVRWEDFLAAGGGFLRSHEDWELWIRLLHGRPDTAVRFLAAPSLRYRQKAASRNAASLQSDIYPSVVRRIFTKHEQTYRDWYHQVINPEVISMPGASGSYRWVALRPINGLTRREIRITATAFTNILDFIEKNKLMAPDIFAQFAKAGLGRFKHYRVLLLWQLPKAVSLRMLRHMLAPIIKIPLPKG